MPLSFFIQTESVPVFDGFYENVILLVKIGFVKIPGSGNAL